MKDYYSDYGHNFVKIFKNCELPDFVKEAEMLSEEKLSNLPDEAFANKIARKLPVSSPADTYISTAYHLFCNDQDENVSASLDKAANFWGITEDVEKLKASILSLSKEASSQSEAKEWLISYSTDANGGMLIFGKGNDSESLSKSWKEFYKNAVYLPFSERVLVAKQYSKEFEKMGMDLTFELGAMSENNFPNADIAAQEIKSRAIRIDDHKKRAELIKLAESVEQSEDRDLDGFSKLAETIDSIDAQYYLGRFYGKNIKNAHEAIFNTPRKQAILSCGTLKIASDEYGIEDLKEIHPDIFKIALTEEDYNMITKNASKAEDKIDHSLIPLISEESKKNLANYL